VVSRRRFRVMSMVSEGVRRACVGCLCSESQGATVWGDAEIYRVTARRLYGRKAGCVRCRQSILQVRTMLGLLALVASHL
jgi:hypothetical protein